MGAVYFYHLTQSSLEATLPQLLVKALGVGWRVHIRGTSADRMSWLNDKLWLGREAEFLPHGLAGGEFDAVQPILLSTDTNTNTDAGNNPECLMAVDGAEVSAQEVMDLERVCVVFDGNDAPALEIARSQWKSLTEAGCAAQYWSQDTGKWQMKAESD